MGVRGHAAVAAIAEGQLSPAARRTVAALPGSEGKTHLYEVSSWADEIKQERRKGFGSHTILLRLNGDPDAKGACDRHFCAVHGLRRFFRILRDPKQSVAKREEALKMVVHLVGDIHEPLHTVRPTGSNVAVAFGGERTNLHKVWDTLMLRGRGNALELAKTVQRITPRTTDTGHAMDWVLEARTVAQGIYRDLPAKNGEVRNLAGDYGRRNWPAASLQLRRAGDRLARLLNQALSAG